MLEYTIQSVVFGGLLYDSGIGRLGEDHGSVRIRRLGLARIQIANHFDAKHEKITEQRRYFQRVRPNFHVIEGVVNIAVDQIIRRRVETAGKSDST